MKKNHILMLAIAIPAVLLGILLNSNHSNLAKRAETPSIIFLPNPKPLISTNFTDHNNQPFVTSDFKGKWSLLFFGFTHCPDICPTTLQTLKQIKHDLQAKNSWDNLQVVFISVDPKRDTPEQLANYVPYFDKEFLGLVTDDKSTEAFAKQLGILYLTHKADETGSYDVDHSVSIVLVDPQAKMAGVLTAPHDAKQITKDLAELNSYFKESSIAELELINSWIRPAPPSSASMAGYGTLKNNTDTDIEISAVNSPAFEMAMIHNTVIENGVAKMLHLDELIIPAKGEVQLKPQGLHLMLMQPKSDLQIGEHVELIIEAENGESYRQTIEVKPQPK